ncbi:MAG: hypothetical protein ACLQPH_14640 [Acidimicrobiales bacterium]
MPSATTPGSGALPSDENPEWPWDRVARLTFPNLQWSNPLPAIESLLRRDEADVVLVAGNVVLVALEIIEWPVAALTLAVHLLARSRFKGLEAMAEVADETE